jgi:dipeptidyl aminopeptidase/acylaminoacyl peptidase
MRNLTVLAASLILLAACGKPSTEPTPQTTPAPPPAEVSATEPTELIPRGTLFGNPERTIARISPDGAHVSWLAPKDGVMNIWVAPADDAENPKAVTNDTNRGIRTYFWAPNSKFIYYTQDDGGNENFHVYSTNIATGEVVDLTPVKEGARATIEAVSSQRPDHIVVGINERDSQIFDLYIVDVTTSERELLMENPGYAAWVIDNDFVPRFGLQPTPDGGGNVVDMDGNLFAVIPPEDFLTTQTVGFNAANDALYLLDSRGRDTAALTRVSIESGEVEVLAENPDADISAILTDARTFEPVAYNADYLKSTWYPLDDGIAADLEALTAALPGSLSIVATTEDMSTWVVHEDSSNKPGAYYLFDSETNSVDLMVVQEPELAAYQLAPMRAVKIMSRDGLELVSYLTLPVGSDADGDGRPEDALPMILAVHGGPWARDQYGYHPWHQWLANRGYAVLSVNYRGSTGFGKEFTRAAIGEFAGKMHDDLLDGVQWAIDAGIADADKVAIVGGSYGGYATLIGVSFTPDTFACGVDLVGPSSLVTLIESFPDYWKPWLQGTWYTYVGDPALPGEREDMLARSAISRIDDIKVPLLVGQGENDPRVTKLESDQLVEAMAANELPVTYVNFPDEGHGFQRPENRLAFYSVMEGFLESCLGGQSEPVDDAFDGSTIEILYGKGYIGNLFSEDAAD